MMKLFSYFFIFLLLGCALPSFFSRGKESTPDTPNEREFIDHVACQVDEDCVLVPADCCGCNNGGKSIAVHKSQQESYKSNLQRQCSSLPTCKTVYLCGNIQVQCKNSECVAVPKS